jgi:hypothetical protein
MQSDAAWDNIGIGANRLVDLIKISDFIVDLDDVYLLIHVG